MSNVISGRITAGLALAAAAAVAATALDTRADTALPLQCEVTISAESLPISAEPVEVEATISEAVGDTVTVTFAEDSKVTVVSVEQAGEDDPNGLKLTVNTAEAVAGDWAVVVRGEAGECHGTATVVAADPGR